MDEKKPLIYRLKTDIKPSGYNIPKMFVDEIKTLAALPASMRDELLRPSPKWVTDAKLTDAKLADLDTWLERRSTLDQIIAQSIEYYQQTTEAENILGIDRNRPETVEPWCFMPESMVLQEAKRLKGVQQQARQLTERGTLTLILRSLDDLPESADDEVMAYLQRRGAIKKLLTPRGRGNRPNQQYVTAFERVYILKTHSLKNAFEAMLIEEQIRVLDESDRADRWNAFTQAMKRLKKKSSH